MGAIDGLVALIWGFFEWGEYATREGPSLLDFMRNAPEDALYWGTGVTLAVILFGSLNQMFKLRAGGEAVAKAFKAVAVNPRTKDPAERRLINVVEEMAIASGVRVPALYIMDNENAINAFAAGFSVSNTVLVVTRGMLKTLTRDELQGVIGHEFSHILNGDVSLNIRMMGVLAGIVVVGAIGVRVMAAAFEADSFSSGVATFFLGLTIAIIGGSGLVSARLIKASVSRQREYLADASSVQFTRNPDGIAGALDRIAGGKKALIKDRYAEDVSHMFFGQAVSSFMGGVFNTHPPIDERIKRVAPNFQRTSYRKKRSATSEVSGDEATTADDSPEEIADDDVRAAAVGFASETPRRAAKGRTAKSTDAHRWSLSASGSAALVGTLDADKIDYAQRLIASIPDGLRERLQDADSARAAIVALVLADQDSERHQQLAAAKMAGVGPIADSARELALGMASLGIAFQLPVLDLALATLRSSSNGDNAAMLTALDAVIHADQRVSLHEFALLTLVRSQLVRRSGSPQRIKNIAAARAEAIAVLSLIASSGAPDGAEGQQAYVAAFNAGAREMALAGAVPVGRDSLDLEAAGKALETLRGLAPRAKAKLVQGLFAAVTADGTIRVIEAELMRMIGAVLDAPLPPLLDHLEP